MLLFVCLDVDVLLIVFVLLAFVGVCLVRICVFDC